MPTRRNLEDVGLETMPQGHTNVTLSHLGRKHKVHVRLGTEDQFTDARLGVRGGKQGAIIAKQGSCEVSRRERSRSCAVTVPFVAFQEVGEAPPELVHQIADDVSFV